MKLRFVKDYTQFKVGDTIDDTQIGVAYANGLVNLGLAERMPEEKPAKKVEKGAQQ
ncbi:hypothetical protein [Sinorhizobium meliloti]|uniref:hypothetical protein n=1 Tax=Rhizobium meliloti TaxID=382 RepID=UPI0001E4D325|nr:hypothetical protein [Sinorhizobium meliloti]AEG52574.1 hypothetical protein Sinme_0816 [Sinorhizobium meliloti AK83]MDE4591709.1 hypothetical protein [Sinorhizobium meliloti]SEJ02825.1 hypothetical protein SAMN04244575_02788 [Sinorhizobium meliloti]